MGEVINVSIPEAARRLGVCARTVAKYIQSKELGSRRIGRRRVIPVAEMKRFNRRDHPTAQPSGKPAKPKSVSPKPPKPGNDQEHEKCA